jgi:hypothetical protein
MLSSTAKIVLICLTSLLYVSGCGTPTNSDSSNASSRSSTPAATSLELRVENGNSPCCLKLTWDDMNAAQYRVLYWQGTDAPDEITTTGTAYTLPPLSRGDYTVIAEAYDALGNSVFSAPVAMKVF